jgi:hypothetical protein
MRPSRLIETRKQLQRGTWHATIELSAEAHGYNPTMATTPKPRPKGPWTPEEVARNERAQKAQVKLDRARGAATDLEEAAALARFANRFSEAFRDVRGA